MINATLPKVAWTMNMAAVEGSVNDSYKFNPWRAPGYAPVVDPCGQAGGKYKQTPMGGDSAYYTTKYGSSDFLLLLLLLLLLLSYLSFFPILLCGPATRRGLQMLRVE